MAYQLCARDEYRHVSILEVGTEIEPLIEKARTLVTNENMENALTMTEKEKDFTHILPQFLDGDQPTLEAVYAGRDGKDQHVVLLVGDSIENSDEISLSSLMKQTEDLGLRFYIGTTIINRREDITKEFFAKNLRGDIISDMDDHALEGKTVFYIKKI